MAKTYLSTVKYIIRTNFIIEGIVDKHDIIGAIFGQSEGLIGEEMDLKELQKNGKLGRIEVETRTKTGKTVGTLTVPSSLDRVQTSILAAAVESVDKVGPCNSSFRTEKIEDARQEKRKLVTDRAKELLKGIAAEIPETQEIAQEIRDRTRTSDLREIGRDKIAVGPDIDASDELILVEGRADVINLLKHGIKNTAAVGGAKVPRTVVNLAKGKNVTLFVDGDRGGDIIARQLGQAMKVDFVAKAPDGKEVEELTLKEILSALRKKGEAGSEEAGRSSRFYPNASERGPPRGRTSYSSERGPATGRASYGSDRGSPRGRTGERGPGRRPTSGRAPRREPRGFSRDRSGFGVRPAGRRPFMRKNELGKPAAIEAKPNDLGEFSEHMKALEGSLKARFLDEKMKPVKEVNVRDLLKEMEKHKKVEAVVLDGIITKRLLQEAEKNKVKQLVGVKKGRIEESKEVKVSTLY
jgi:DNA primase